MGPMVSQFTFARHSACYPLCVGDFRGPAIGAAGRLHFEPDGMDAAAYAAGNRHLLTLSIP
jgi:hypothetical protein